MLRLIEKLRHSDVITVLEDSIFPKHSSARIGLRILLDFNAANLFSRKSLESCRQGSRAIVKTLLSPGKLI